MEKIKALWVNSSIPFSYFFLYVWKKQKIDLDISLHEVARIEI